MATSFEKILYKALQKSTVEDNLVLKEANRIIGRGYPLQEIINILERFKKGLIDPTETEIIVDTLEELLGEEDDY